jgi:hypothetical protein
VGDKAVILGMAAPFPLPPRLEGVGRVIRAFSHPTTGFPMGSDNGGSPHPAMKIERIVSTRLPTPYGEFAIHGFREGDSGQEHVVLSLGDLTGDEPPLVRVHSECMTGEVFGSLRCDCRPQLEGAMKRIAAQGRGAIVYMRGHEGRGIGLVQ